MPTIEHVDIDAGEVHRPYNFSYANAAARTSATGFAAGDVGKFARQTDDNSIWMLTATTPTWIALGAGTGITSLTGDVTASGSGSVAATIANDAVTFAKMLNASAASVLIGRGSASGAGDFQEVTLGSGLTMTGTVLSASGGGGSGTVASSSADQVPVYTGATTVTGGTDWTFTRSTAAKTMTITSAASSALIRVTPTTSGNSGFSNTTSVHPGSGGGLFLPFVAGSQSDGPGIWWTNGGYSGLAGLWLSGGFNLQGWNSSNSSLKIHKGTGTSSDGATMFTFDPDTPAMTLGDGVNIVLNTTTGTKLGTSASQKLGLWNATPIVQPSGANQAAITDSTTGTAGFTLSDVGVVFAQATINNNFASLARLVDNMRTALVNSGLMKGAA